MLSSSIRLWATPDDYLTLEYASAQAYYEPFGERIADRSGLVHRLAPGSARYPVWLTLSLLPEELCGRNSASAPVARSVIEWLELCLRGSALITVFVRGETLLPDGATPLVRNIAYRGYIEEMSSGLASLPGSAGGGSGGAGSAAFATGASAGEPLLLRLLITEDGTFSDYDALASYAPYEPGRG